MPDDPAITRLRDAFIRHMSSHHVLHGSSEFAFPRPYAEQPDGPQPKEAPGLQTADLDNIAVRHYDLGHEKGYRTGLDVGSTTTADRIREQERMRRDELVSLLFTEATSLVRSIRVDLSMTKAAMHERVTADREQIIERITGLVAAVQAGKFDG